MSYAVFAKALIAGTEAACVVLREADASTTDPAPAKKKKPEPAPEGSGEEPQAEKADAMPEVWAPDADAPLDEQCRQALSEIKRLSDKATALDTMAAFDKKEAYKGVKEVPEDQLEKFRDYLTGAVNDADDF